MACVTHSPTLSPVACICSVSVPPIAVPRTKLPIALSSMAGDMMFCVRIARTLSSKVPLSTVCFHTIRLCSIDLRSRPCRISVSPSSALVVIWMYSIIITDDIAPVLLSQSTSRYSIRPILQRAMFSGVASMHNSKSPGS